MQFKKSYSQLSVIIISLLFTSCGEKFTSVEKDGFVEISNSDGSTLGYKPESGVKILTVDRYAFKDLNKNDKLDTYEDWRLSFDERARDLASKMTIEQIAGLMLYSVHQSLPARPGGYFAGTYNGQPFKQGVNNPADLTDQQKKFLSEDNLRHILMTKVESPVIAAQWSNKIQAYCEGIGLGIPANNSTDPRNGTTAKAEYDAAAGGEISMWPSSLGMAATFDPELVKQFGEIASAEYRALGLTTALSPQIDMATEPRWARFSGTFGESPKLSAAMAKAYIDGFQTSVGKKEIKSGWGFSSVNAMVKHWPGGGTGEGGRDAHYGAGQFAVYPGNNFDEHLIPFTEGALKLDGETNMASAVMPYYTISWNQDVKYGENVANGYSKYLITDLLREKYGYDGVVCTDWLITRERRALDQFIDGKPFGVENLTIAERHYKVLMAGADQFGGNNEVKPVVEAYEIGSKEHGAEKMRARMEESAVRLLKNIFRVGLFENPYLDPAETKKIVGKPEFMKAGYDAQLKSVVMLKNVHKVLPLSDRKTVYIPRRFVAASRNFLGMEIPSTNDYPVNIALAKKYFDLTENPDEADMALVVIENPDHSIGYDKADVDNGGNGYIPISLQYSDYTASDARAQSIAGGDPLEDFTNRSYKNKSTKTANHTDAILVSETKEKMNGKPVLVAVNTSNPMVFSEIEKDASAILINFGVQDQALFDIITGKAKPSALLPMQMPADMITVEKQAEDVPFDMNCYKDAEGNVYDFGFGMDWDGVIDDERVSRFK